MNAIQAVMSAASAARCWRPAGVKAVPCRKSCDERSNAAVCSCSPFSNLGRSCGGANHRSSRVTYVLRVSRRRLVRGLDAIALG